MIKITSDRYYRVEIEGYVPFRCTKIVKGKYYDDAKAKITGKTMEYYGEYAVLPDGNNCKLILG